MINLNFSFNECVNKSVFINLIEDGEINVEFMIINNINDYNYLKEYINSLINENILSDYFIYN